MKLDKRKPTGREKDEASVNLLEQLRQKLYTDNASVARRAAFNLSWMQEDGFEILQEALFRKDVQRRTRSAAAYGLRSMHGRMKKASREVLEHGSQDENREISDICRGALQLLNRGKEGKAAAAKRAQKRRVQIREVTAKRKRRPSGLRQDRGRRGGGLAGRRTP